MLAYFFRRLLYMLVVVWLVSLVSFLIIQLPAGDFVTTLAVQYARQGRSIDQAQLDNLRHQFGLDQPVYVQYFRWAWNFTRGDRVGLTAAITLSALLFTYIVAVPIGIYSATHQYSAADYLGMFVGFVGMALPGFMVALILMYVFLNAGMRSVGGLFSPDYMRAEWSVAKLIDLFKHLPLPILIIGLSGTAGLIRIIRATLLDELGKQYVITARSKGLRETRLLFKYPVRVALNPIISTIGWELPYIVSGGLIVEMVLNLPTVGPLLYSSLLTEDMFLASSLLFLLNFLTVVGTFISDVLLVIVDPRIRFTGREA
jgi:peptide/nickel transport system permease protein